MCMVAGSLLGADVLGQTSVERTYFENGMLRSTQYVAAGALHFIHYYENGKVREMGSYRNGSPDGPWRQFDASGALTARVRFQKGRPVGESDLYLADRNLSGKLYYQEGALRKAEMRNALGELVATKDY
ncbi:MAG: hypothetical protein KDB88_07865, partial [Flavobacteriales bacterium]|nr:hypothetical protein [Flavobacteriales bacterium]